MAYNSKYTGAQVEALLDRAGEAPQTYDIGWLLAIIDGIDTDADTPSADLTQEQWDEVTAAADAGKVFTGAGAVWNYYQGDSSYESYTYEFIKFVSPLQQSSYDYTLSGYVGVVTTFNIVRTISSSNVVLNHQAYYYDTLRLVCQDALGTFAKKTDIPDVSSFLKLKYQLADISGSLTPSLTVAAGNWYYLLRGVANPTSLSLTISDPGTSDNSTDPIMLRFSTGNKAMSISVSVGTNTDGVLVRDGGTLECKANTYYTLTFWRYSSYWLAELREYSVAGTATSGSSRTVVKTNESTIGYGTSYVATQPSIELAADKFHIVGRCTGLTLTLPDGADTDGQEYCCQFYVGPSSFTLTLPESVYWQNGEAPEFASNTCCQLVIVNNCATIGVFKAS